MFTSRELKAFISVAEKKSVKLAADELNISSPAVCSMLKKFEGRVNNKLFIFEKNRMTLTQYGERIYTLTNGHFHALKSLEANLKNNKKIIKVFVSKDLEFLSSFIINQFKKISIEVMLTSFIDKSTDIIINDITTHDIDSANYNSILAHLTLYLVYDKLSKNQDIFIHKDYSQFIKKNTTKKFTDEIDNKLREKSNIILSDDITSIVETLLSSLGATILPHICSVLKCLTKSELNLTAINDRIPLHIHIKKGHNYALVEEMFMDKIK